MKITSVRLKNGYKRFHDLTINLGRDPSRFIALVGPNGCGKSSILDGLLFHQSAYEPVGSTGQMDQNFHSMRNAPNYDYRNIEIQFTNGTYLQVLDKKRADGKERTIFSFRSPYRYNSNVKVTETRSLDNIVTNSYGASTTVALDEKMETNYRRLLAKFNRYRDERDVKPSTARKHIIAELNKAIKSCLDLEISSLGDVESNRGTIFFRKSDQSVEFEYNVLSSGEKEVVDILLDLYLRKEDYDDTVFLIDEPELHISTAIQKRLLVEIDKMIGENCQVWVATHSIGFLRALQEDITDSQVIFFEPDMDLAVSPHVLSPIQKTRSHWQTIFQTALDDLSGLVGPKRLIYCEGKAETGDGSERGVDAQVYNNVFSETESDTLFVSSGGNSEPEQRSRIAITILKKAFVDLEILVLADRDIRPGRETTGEDREKYLRDCARRRMLKRRELENYLYDEEVLRKYSIANSVDFDEERYRREVMDIRNDNVKDKTGLIKLVCGETRSLSANRFKIELSRFLSSDMDVYKELHECIFS